MLAQKELDRLSKTVRRMLDFYRPGATRYEQVDLVDLLNHVMSLTSAQLRSKNVTANIELPDSLPAIFAVSSQLQQIFFNLILNALDAMPDGGELSIRARAVTDGVEIMFEDSGSGIPEGRRENIFEPFFSTKEGGTGLGLTVSYNIATAHGGTLDLIEGHGSGACFRLFLPMGDKQ